MFMLASSWKLRLERWHRSPPLRNGSVGQGRAINCKFTIDVYPQILPLLV